MTKNTHPISGVPTHVITGFLGVGKTTTILHLLNEKPAQERWAVLVNEFGEVGIDGALIRGKHPEGDGVFIREVPGGCMCCTAGLPMHVALAELLRRAKPHRLLIEPSGLGHPTEVLSTLRSEPFTGVLSIKPVITIIDARHLSIPRYRENETFQQQLEIADVLVANKRDLYSDIDIQSLRDTTQQLGIQSDSTLLIEQGELKFDAFMNSSDINDAVSVEMKADLAKPAKTSGLLESDDTFPSSGIIRKHNQGSDFQSTGWRFESRIRFNQDKLFQVLSGLDVERMKAVFKTEEGAVAYNATPQTMSEFCFDSIDESRIEIIAAAVPDDLEEQLVACIADRNIAHLTKPLKINKISLL